MKTYRATKAQRFLIGLALLLVPAAGSTLAQGPGPQAPLAPQAQVGTSFTYQGQLKSGGSPYNGSCDLQFSLWDAAGSGSPPAGGSQVGTTWDRTNVTVSEGLFTVELNFVDAFTGDARWLQIAVRCPAGSGTYTALSPRQPLTAAPYALSLRPGTTIHNKAPVGAGTTGLSLRSDTGDGLYVGSAGWIGLDVVTAGWHGLAVGSAGWDGVYVHKAGSPTATVPSDASNGFEVAGAGGNGLFVGQADANGVYVNSVVNHGVYVGSAGRNGVQVNLPGDNGMYVGSAGNNGVYVNSASHDGVHVSSAGDNGVYVHSAGTPSMHIDSISPDGFEVAGAQGNGLFVGQADLTGVFVHSAGTDGVHVYQAGSPSTMMLYTGHDGFEVEGAQANGLWVGRADERGVYVYSSGTDGVYVHQAGSPSSTTGSAGQNGFEVAGAQGHGLWVGQADQSGVYVNSATNYGVYANTTQASNNYGFYTPDNIYSLNYHLAGAMMLVAQSGDGGKLEPGDVVAVSGVGSALAEGEPPVALVRRAGPGDGAVMGVVYRRYVAEKQVEEVEREGQVKQQTSLHTRSAEGPIAPGDYLLVVVLGPAQVKVAAASGAGLRPGDLLTMAPNGQATKATPVKVGETSFYAPGAVIGQAMSASDPTQGASLVWMLVMPR